MSLPPAVADEVARHIGPVDRTVPLGGLSGRTVLAVHGGSGVVVAKGPVAPAEVLVGTSWWQMLVDRGVIVPQVHGVVEVDDQGSWLVMEYLEQPWPRERWGADPALIAVLQGLHTAPVSLVSHEEFDSFYHPRWDDALTARAAQALALDDTARQRLSAVQALAHRLFEPRCVISADPNALNWRQRSDGTPVLLDWERLTLADPAIDLAILLPGLPSLVAAQEAVGRYGSDRIRAVDLLLVKAWTVVELAATAPDGSDASRVVDRVRSPFTEWVDSVLWPAAGFGPGLRGGVQ